MAPYIREKVSFILPKMEWLTQQTVVNEWNCILKYPHLASYDKAMIQATKNGRIQKTYVLK